LPLQSANQDEPLEACESRVKKPELPIQLGSALSRPPRQNRTVVRC